MRKTTLIFLLFTEIVALFLFYNLNHLFIQLGRTEVNRIKDQARQFASLAGQSPQEALSALKENPLFREVAVTTSPPGEKDLGETEPPTLVIRRQIPSGPRIKLTVPIESNSLKTIRTIQSISTGIIVISGLLLLATAAALVVHIRKKKPGSPNAIPIDPLQNYLLNLKGNEIRMQKEVDVVRQTAETKESLTGLILNRVHFGVITLGKGGRIGTFNHKAEQIFRRSYASLANRPFAEALSDYPQLVAFTHEAENKDLAAEITTDSMILSCCAVRLPHQGLLITIEDITAALEDRKRDMEKKSVLQLGEMAAYLSHEVRNSLGVIYGYTKTLKEDPLKIGRINQEIHFLTDMMERFLGFSRPSDPPEQAPCRLGDLAGEICAAHQLEIEQRDPDQSEALADSRLLRNIFDNLLRNSVQAGATRIICSYRKEKNFQEMVLEDNGQGIPPELKEKIWFPFFTTREKGSGMGLALVRKLMLAMNGEISLLSSRPGETRFLLKLPLPQA